MKRKEAEWGTPLGPDDLEKIADRILQIEKEGVQCTPLLLNNETIILHFKVPKAWDTEQVHQVARRMTRMKEQLPENCFSLVTTEELQLQLHRPGDPSDALRKANNILSQRITTLETQYRNRFSKIEEQLMEHYEHLDRLIGQSNPHGCPPTPPRVAVDRLAEALQPKMEIKK